LPERHKQPFFTAQSEFISRLQFVVEFLDIIFATLAFFIANIDVLLADMINVSVKNAVFWDVAKCGFRRQS
jgi:hypothetical protein